MKNNLLILASICLVQISAIAKVRKPQGNTGAQCGLTANWGDSDEYDSTFTSFDLSSPKKISKFIPKIVRKQLIACASGMGDATPGMDYKKALELLREGSEGGEVYALGVTVKKQKYSVISYYGGGNHTGCIFKWGFDKMHAGIGDDEIICMDK